MHDVGHNLIKQIKRLAMEVGMHVGVVQQASEYEQGVYIGEEYTINISGERIADLLDKVALPYKKGTTEYKRGQSDSHWSFDMEPTVSMHPSCSLTTDGNSMFLLADNAVVHT